MGASGLAVSLRSKEKSPPSCPTPILFPSPPKTTWPSFSLPQDPHLRHSHPPKLPSTPPPASSLPTLYSEPTHHYDPPSRHTFPLSPLPALHAPITPDSPPNTGSCRLMPWGETCSGGKGAVTYSKLRVVVICLFCYVLCKCQAIYRRSRMRLWVPVRIRGERGVRQGLY